jgi:hypothetical protein
MKTSTKKVVTYDLMQLTEEEMTLIIHGLMATYQDSEEWEKGKELGRQITAQCHLEPVKCCNDTLCEDESNKVKKPNKIKYLEGILTGMDFDSSICTADSKFGDFTGGKNIYKFIYGKQGQLIIQRWDALPDVNIEKAANDIVALNKACVDMLIDFLRNDGKEAGGLIAFKTGENGMTRVLEAYLDTDGNESYHKHMVYTYNVIEQELTIEKEGVVISFTKYETLILKEFLNYHLG